MRGSQGTLLLAALLGAAVTWLAPLLPLTAAIDHLAYDAWHRLAGSRTPVRHVALAAIDDATLLQFRDTPLAFWQPQLGAAVATLRAVGVRAVGIDLIQATSAESWLEKVGAGDTATARGYEAPFRAALAEGGIVLAAARGSEGDLLPPLEHQLLLPGGLEDTALVNLDSDADGVVRRFRPNFGGEAPALGFAARLALAVQAALPGDAMQARPIPFAGPPGQVPRVSLATLAAPDALDHPEVRALAGKVVIVAPEATSLQDLQLTPYARALPGAPPLLMSGGELHAQILEALLGGRAITAVPASVRVPAGALLGLLLALAVARLAPLRSTLLAGGALLALSGASFLVFLADLWLPPAPLLAGGGLAWAAALASRSGREARETNRLRTLFARYVSDEVADLAVSGALPDTGGSEAELTILFLDIRNFTTTSEKLASREVFEMLNAWLPRACAPILAHGGNVDKFIGDAVMAVFGAPVAQPDHARRAIAAAREIVQAAEEFRGWLAERFPDRGLPPFAIGIGIHSGKAVVGNLGTERRVEFTAIGDAVNLASRLESATKELGWRIVASRATLEAAGAGIAAGARSEISVKGKTAPVEVVEIL
jgi:class 3 adenylate cyclase/CHASE2 domain-containing sensor protein